MVRRSTENSTGSVYDFEALQMNGQSLPLRQYAGQVMLIVNTASACGFTTQSAGLQALPAQYADQGLVVLGFPCNQFGHQEPGSNDEIAHFCQRNDGVDFPMMAKIDVNGSSASPLYRWLTAQAPGLLGSKAIKCNFSKFHLGKDGRVLRRTSWRAISKPLWQPETWTERLHVRPFAAPICRPRQPARSGFAEFL